MEAALAVQQDVRRNEQNPAADLFAALAMPALNAVANPIVATQILSAANLESLSMGSTAKEVANSFLHIQQQNTAFAAMSFDYINSANSIATARADNSLQLAA
jgi:hypothetical protein